MVLRCIIVFLEKKARVQPCQLSLGYEAYQAWFSVSVSCAAIDG